MSLNYKDQEEDKATMKKIISYDEIMGIIWNLKGNEMDYLIGDYSKMNAEIQAIRKDNISITDKERKILEVLMKFVCEHDFYESFMRKCGFYKRGMEKYLSITIR